MLGKRPGPMIGKLSELLVSGGGRAVSLLDTTLSPRGPLDMKASSSPRSGGLKKGYDLGGVGLGIVVALDKPSKGNGNAVCAPNFNRSGPIPIHSTGIANGFHRVNEEIDVGSEEDYTYVTCHLPNKTFTKVYYDGVQKGFNNNNVGVLRRTTEPAFVETEQSFFPTSNFLSSCHLCRKKLHGKDIYMYRGEKAFCSTECRSSQIMMDERKERCRSEGARSVELSSSPYTTRTREQIFSTEILAL